MAAVKNVGSMTVRWRWIEDVGWPTVLPRVPVTFTSPAIDCVSRQISRRLTVVIFGNVRGRSCVSALTGTDRPRSRGDSATSGSATTSGAISDTATLPVVRVVALLEILVAAAEELVIADEEAVSAFSPLEIRIDEIAGGVESIFFVAAERGRAAALWSGTNKSRDVSTGPLARPFARSLAPLTRGKVNF